MMYLKVSLYNKKKTEHVEIIVFTNLIKTIFVKLKIYLTHKTTKNADRKGGFLF